MKKKISSLAAAGFLVAAQLNVFVFVADTISLSSVSSVTPVHEETKSGTINLSVGQRTNISLDQGGFAGIMWKYSIGDTSIVSLKSEEFISPPHETIDALSKHIWTFVANRAGTTKITFTSRFETKVYTVNVKAHKFLNF